MAQSPILAAVTHSSLFNCGLSSPSQDSRWDATYASSKPNCHHLPKNQVLQTSPFSSFCSYSVHLPVKSVLSIFSAEAACPLPLSTSGIVTRSTFLFIFTVPPQHALHCLYACGMCTHVCIHVSECSCRYMHVRVGACVQARVQARVSLLMCDL